MARGFKISGFAEVRTRLNTEIAVIKGKTMVGLINSAILIRRDMEHTSPKVPVDLGNLRASWVANPVHTPKGPTVLIGFTANYAVAVHEKKKKHKWSRPGSGPKFLEKALERNHDKILQTIRNHARIK